MTDVYRYEERRAKGPRASTLLIGFLVAAGLIAFLSTGTQHDAKKAAPVDLGVCQKSGVGDPSSSVFSLECNGKAYVYRLKN